MFSGDLAFAGARLQGLDRTTTRTLTFDAQDDLSVFFGRLEVIVRRCKKSAPTEPPENTAFLEIYEYPLTVRARIAQRLKQATSEEIVKRISKVKRAELHQARLAQITEQYGADILNEPFEPNLVFSGWMFSSSPPLNALEHPVYDIWVLSCIGN